MSIPHAKYVSRPFPRENRLSYPRIPTDIPTHAPGKEIHRSSNLRCTFSLCLSVFTILELGFIVLASIAEKNPIPLKLPFNITLTEAKGASTVISILWHGLAIFAVKDILLHISSAEWMEQYRRSGSLIPGEADVVSRMTTGLFDQVKHFLSRKATHPFRVGFICTLLLIALNALGPGVLSVSSIALDFPQKIEVANLTLTDTFSANALNFLAADRANLITRLELLEDTSYGFQSPSSNVLIPWPSPDFLLTNKTVKYESDVITYEFSCTWTQPRASDIMSVWKTDYGDWTVFVPPFTQPLSLSQDLILSMTELVPNSDANSSLSAFFFLESQTISKNSLNLTDIPTNFIPSNGSSTFGVVVSSSLVSALICDPHLHLAPATVTLSKHTLQVAIHSGPPVVKNIPVRAANAIFSQSLILSVSSPEFTHGKSTISAIARILFLTDASLKYDTSPAVKPLSLNTINQRMNTLLLSSAKAFLSGYRPNVDNLTFPAYEMVSTDATVEVEQLALTGSRPFLIILLVVFCVLMVLLEFLVVGVRVDRLWTFDLESVVKVLGIE